MKPFVSSNACLICGHAEDQHYCEDEGGGYHGDDWCFQCSTTVGVGSRMLHHHQYVNAQKRVEELEAALRPFAQYADTMTAHDENTRIFGDFLVKHFRDASKVERGEGNGF